ncbi:MAG: hypothetical protein KDC42_02085 [Ignavibacteriae bacterium]|nr:hypothetical protein [Ignavibacteriota bacterium]
MKIEYTTDSVEGEPGPNLYFMASPEECSKLANLIHPLGETNDIEIDLTKEDWIEIVGKDSLLLRSKADGNILMKLDGEKMIMELDNVAWRTFCIEMFAISFYRCHNYIDFDGCDYHEDAQIIISSEW